MHSNPSHYLVDQVGIDRVGSDRARRLAIVQSVLRSLVAFGLVLGFLPTPATSQSPVPVTVAVDTSRSLRPGDLRATTDELARVLGSLPSNQPTGLLAFDDSPRWVVPVGGTPSDVATALATLQPTGNFTQLHDALVVAARAMENGGIILLATDGRDENSATTLEDVARVCEVQGVRILPVAMGDRLAERNLRRLALLTGGDYLAREGSDAIVEAVTQATSELEATAGERQRSRSQAEPTAASPSPATRQPPASETSTPGGSREDAAPPKERLPLPLILALVAILVLAAALARLLNQRGRVEEPIEESHYCPRCGTSIVGEGAMCDRCEEEGLVARLREYEVTKLQDTAEVPLQSGESVVEGFDPAILEVTRVLADENMITIRGNGKEPRSYLLRSESAFAVGRDTRGNTVGLNDHAMSGHHFKIVPEDGQYIVIDLGSTNGTYVNDQAIRGHRLKSGDVIRAGRTEFEFRSKARALY
ncbi:MAG: FHA domain-containing protein [Thermoanaerobaculia bacterium]|nr:FHA domain-containing protein [Thermoanaerobaculia bacterium]